MRNFIVCDSRTDFLNDINTSLLLEAYPFQVNMTKSFSEACAQATKYPGADIILSEIVLDDANLSALPRKPYGYAVTPNGNQRLQALGVRSLGLCRTSAALLNALSQDPLKIVQGTIADKDNVKRAPDNRQRPNNQTAQDKTANNQKNAPRSPAGNQQKPKAQQPTTPAQPRQENRQKPQEEVQQAPPQTAPNEAETALKPQAAKGDVRPANTRHASNNA